MNSPKEDQNREVPELKYADVYESPEWQSLDEIDRTQLLLVAEGVKPGTFIYPEDFGKLPKILKQMGLDYKLNTDWHKSRDDRYKLNHGYVVGRPEVLSKYIQQRITVPRVHSIDYGWRIEGEFLGYPPCCVEEYCNPQKNKVLRTAVGDKFNSNFGFELNKLIEKTGTYPEEFDFCPPSFTPCSPHCEASLKLLHTWMEVLKKGDPKAARVLQLFHWKDPPMLRVHADELEKLGEERWMDYKIEQIRESVKNTEAFGKKRKIDKKIDPNDPEVIEIFKEAVQLSDQLRVELRRVSDVLGPNNEAFVKISNELGYPFGMTREELYYNAVWHRMIRSTPPLWQEGMVLDFPGDKNLMVFMRKKLEELRRM